MSNARVRMRLNRPDWFGIRGLRVQAWLPLLAVVPGLLVSSLAMAQSNAKNVLLLFSSAEQARSSNLVEPVI
jgi:hypothetical protein